MTTNQELVDYFNTVEAEIRDLRRIQKKAVDRTLPGVYSMISNRIERMKRERVETFTGQGQVMLLSYGRRSR